MKLGSDRFFAIANNWLLGLIVLVALYIVLMPLYPALLFRVQDHSGRRQQLNHRLQVLSRATVPLAEQGDRLIVPSMLLDAPVYEGPARQQYALLNKGMWRYSNGSTPDKGGNTVLVGHRFSYTNPRGIFYFLNKVKLGDQLGLQWNDHLYHYKVSEIKEVAPSDVAIEAPTADNRLTLFTCTPLWLPKHRLVVVAQLEPRP